MFLATALIGFITSAFCTALIFYHVFMDKHGTRAELVIDLLLLLGIGSCAFITGHIALHEVGHLLVHPWP